MLNSDAMRGPLGISVLTLALPQIHQLVFPREKKALKGKKHFERETKKVLKADNLCAFYKPDIIDNFQVVYFIVRLMY